MEGTLCCPLPHTYVAAQLDIQATIQNLDPLTQEAARTIKPAKCLLYLYDALRYPHPGTPTTFEAYIVGLGLRAEDPENGFTADMCVPIFPTTAHPNNRPAVLPKTRFPFSNCYHWAYVDILLRVSSGEFPGLGGSSRLIRLAAGEQARMDRLLTKDLTTAILAKKARRETSPRLGYDSEEDVFTCSTRKVPEDLLPIVTVSVDLSESLDETDLPDPVEFLRQYNALLCLAKESNARREVAVGDDAVSVSRTYTESDHSILRRDLEGKGVGRPGSE
ncbi:hypothetical protein GSI_04319 [Ganoderma sinense ZZ0214-1]|uniref:Uncharacterized protein n=1 Tax=Ganoderma sinense ZZ0214-1 TaxID=1077348 RepID=A0A2G8SIU7_9APHY|nr:hypothetical protein GSI_04319 [Ganoderma sinense ZZ0214-1]